MHRPIARAVVVLAALLALAGCGEDDEGPSAQDLADARSALNLRPGCDYLTSDDIEAVVGWTGITPVEDESLGIASCRWTKKSGEILSVIAHSDPDSFDQTADSTEVLFGPRIPFDGVGERSLGFFEEGERADAAVLAQSERGLILLTLARTTESKDDALALLGQLADLALGRL
ncbi:hypothetical protein [Nocardioides stalactiti]|uniref:hypothetical protein n=1 Tax=Nocardioides stalactiti TaxID=2755356 RepID=UPI0016020AB6|nr:hypothetical protein [Nocardioides stalactiti]